MNKKIQKDGKPLNTLYKYFKKNIGEDKTIVQTVRKIQSKKKVCPKLDVSEPCEQKSSSTPMLSKKNHVFTFVKSVTIEQICQKCPKLSIFLIKIEQSVNFRKKMVKRLLKKYLESNSSSLWSDKYIPNDCSELYNAKAGETIKRWFEAFFEFKNKINTYTDPCLNDFEEQKPCEIYKIIKQNNWKLGALVVRGRPGIGKSSAIKAVAHQLQIEWQQCGNHFNPTKYLKEKNESTQSQSVKTAITRKIKLEKNAQTITKFLPSNQFNEKQKGNQTTKCQLIHHIGSIYPQIEAGKFYTELSRCIQFSKIPFIMTHVGESLPFECQNYDQIAYEIGEHAQIVEDLWIICHFQKLLRINTTKIIERVGLFEQINNQIASVQFLQIVSLRKIRQLCNILNYQLDKIFSYFEYYNLEIVNLGPLLLEKYSNFTKESFLESMPYLATHEKEQNIVKSIETISQVTEDQIFNQDHKAEDLLYIKGVLISNLFKECEMYNLEVQTNVHKGIRKKLAKKVNSEINIYYDRSKSSLKQSELHYFPMLVRKIPTIKQKICKQQFQVKFFNQNERLYAKRYLNFINKN